MWGKFRECRLTKVEQSALTKKAIKDIRLRPRAQLKDAETQTDIHRDLHTYITDRYADRTTSHYVRGASQGSVS